MLEWSQASSGKGLSIPHWSTKAPLGARHKSCNPWKQSRAAEEKPICFAAVCNICRKGVVFCFGFLLFFSRKPESWAADIWRRVVYKGEAVLWQLAGAEWQMLLQTSAVGQHNNKTIPLIWHLIPLSTGPQPLSRHSALIIKTHSLRISLGGMVEGRNKKKKSQRAQAQGKLVNITADRVGVIGF